MDRKRGRMNTEALDGGRPPRFDYTKNHGSEPRAMVTERPSLVPFTRVTASRYSAGPDLRPSCPGTTPSFKPAFGCARLPAMDSVSEDSPSPVRQLIRRGMVATLPRRLFLASGPASSRSISLTFDDGPDPTHTPEVLERLHALGARATFFVVGRNVESHPDLVRRIAREGHEIGHHSFTHGPPHLTSAKALADEARRTSTLLASITGKPPRLYRPPHGKLTPGKLLALWSQGQTIVLWNRDPKDFACGGSEPLRSWFRTAPFAGGDILLLHDVHAHVAPALDALAERIAQLGLRYTTPVEWTDG